MQRLAWILFAGCASSVPPSTTPATPTPAGPPEPSPAPPPDIGAYRMVLPSSLTFSQLDDVRGRELAVVSGDLQRGGGFFLRVAPGHRTALHTHPSDYHAIVISGAPRHWLAGEDRKAQPLGAGSYWFQPGNQPHGDECTGREPCLLYLVTTGAFATTPTPTARPEKPGSSSYLLVARKDVKLAPLDPAAPAGARLGVVSGDPKTGPVALLVELPPGASTGLHRHTDDYHALALDGAPAHWLPHETGEGEPLPSGAYWFQPGGYDHGDRCAGPEPCHVFLMMGKAFDVLPAKGAAR